MDLQDPELPKHVDSWGFKVKNFFFDQFPLDIMRGKKIEKLNRKCLNLDYIFLFFIALHTKVFFLFFS